MKVSRPRRKLKLPAGHTSAPPAPEQPKCENCGVPLVRAVEEDYCSNCAACKVCGNEVRTADGCFNCECPAPPAPVADEMQDPGKCPHCNGYHVGGCSGPIPRLTFREPGAPAAPEGAEPLVIEIARELYDRFVMGGWEPQDAYPQIERWLAPLHTEAARLKALLNYDGQRYESWLEVGQALIDRKAEAARLKESLEILAERADLEKMRADIAEEKVARLTKNRDECAAVFKIDRDHELTGPKEDCGCPSCNLRREVARLEKERDEWKAEEHITSELLDAAEARIREIEKK